MTSDLHIGHKNIHKFRSPENGFPLTFSDEIEHRGWLEDFWRTNITKKDSIYLLGDICFYEEGLIWLHSLPGRKVLVKGNHCVVKNDLEKKVYDQVLGLGRYKGRWLSHAPIHPEELRGRCNYHGHVHHKTLEDSRYFNCCVENLVSIFDKPIVPFQEIEGYRDDNQN